MSVNLIFLKHCALYATTCVTSSGRGGDGRDEQMFQEKRSFLCDLFEP